MRSRLVLWPRARELQTHDIPAAQMRLQTAQLMVWAWNRRVTFHDLLRLG